ncbi:NAD(P)H-binding protein [Christiangramia portivictoriae]|uniref:NAD(P)H-binding protein n=1 Tax=Christiangramia portivictoriae TaxID=326069 RepID=UPI000414477A|nr:NAD(P)H-binding protein [Christiangramia portivictoriae]
MEQAKTAIILGATGLTGGILLDKLVKDDRYRKIRIFGRNHVAQKSEKIEEYLIDLFEMEKVQELFKGDEVFCCIGTTKSKTPDKELYRQIDFGIPATAAKLAKRNNIDTFMVISALGADEDSNIFYNKVKGEMEGAVLEQKIPNTYILQPSLIAGDRAENRLMESIFIKLMKFGNHLLIGNLKKYRTIEPEEIANAMQYLANHQYPGGRIESDKLKAFSNNSA